MGNETQPPDTDAQPADEPRTSGHVERTIVHHLAGADADRSGPTTVGDVLEDVAAVVERGDYGNPGIRNPEATNVRQSTIRRTFGQLAEKGLVQRVADLDPERLREDRFALGELDPGGDPEDPAAYARTADDARVTDWVLTDEGRREVERLDARYEAELDALAARHGRPRGETTARVDA